jgi:hypothetical protein
MAWHRNVLRSAFLLPTIAASQQPLALSKPDVEYAEPFTNIAAIRELRDGRILVLDRRDRIVLLLDLKKGTAQNVGRQGTGPGEYTQPGRLFALPGDTTAIYDGPARRFLLVGPDGKAGDVFRLDLATGAGQRRGGIPKYSDARGRIFTEGSPYAPGEEMRAADSTAITRFDRSESRGDTLGWVHLDKEAIQIRNTPEGGVSVSNGLRPFAWRDDWVALPDGGIAVARVAPYRLDWYSSSGARVVGPTVKVDPLSVTDADKEKAKRMLLANMRAAMPRNGNAANAPAPDAINLPELTFPPTKPPFEVGHVFARPNGEVWVLRSRRANEQVAVYDVFTRTAGLVARVAFPSRTQVIGLGNGTIYTVRLDEDDLQYLQKWTLAFSTRLSGTGRH